jgi:hypothetical protein
MPMKINFSSIVLLIFGLRLPQTVLEDPNAEHQNGEHDTSDPNEAHTIVDLLPEGLQTR